MENNPPTVGELIVLDEWPVKGGKRHSRVLCFCGVEFVVRTDSLKRKNTKSCGCYDRMVSSIKGRLQYKHRHALQINGKTSPSPTYTTWNGMKNRCTNPNVKFYHRYGGRGIKICERWIESFQNFLEDMGEKPGKGYSIDRVDNEGNYEPTNCRWIPRGENARKSHLDRKKLLGL